MLDMVAKWRNEDKKKVRQISRRLCHQDFLLPSLHFTDPLKPVVVKSLLMHPYNLEESRDICIKINLCLFHCVLGTKNNENAFRLLIFIPTWNFCLPMTEIHFGNYFCNLIKMIAPEIEIFEVMFDTIINVTPSKIYVKLWLFFFSFQDY